MIFTGEKSTIKPGFIYGKYKGVTGKRSTTFAMGDNDERYKNIHAQVLAPCMKKAEVDRMNRQPVINEWPMLACSHANLDSPFPLDRMGDDTGQRLNLSLRH